MRLAAALLALTLAPAAWAAPTVKELADMCPNDGEHHLHVQDEGGRVLFEVGQWMEPVRNRYDYITDFTGSLKGTDQNFYFGRDGDHSDGDIEDVGVYDVSTYPYNVHFQHYLWTQNGCGRAEEGCKGFFALGGTWEVLTPYPNYLAVFQLTHLYDGAGEDPGAALSGERHGCIRFNRHKRD